MRTSEHIGKLVLDMSDQEGLEVASMGRPLHVRSDGFYLVTGGFSELGLKGAQWLVDLGARHLGLIGRSGAKSDDDRRFIEQLRDRRIQVLEIRADVSLSHDVARLLAGLPLPVRGVLHLATAYHDVPILEQKDEDLRRVMGVKAKGAHHLLRHLDQDDLDWFVSFSSLASYGSHAQASYAAANTYLDALAHHREAAGQGGGGGLLDRLHAADAGQQREIAEDFIIRHLSAILHVPKERITAGTRIDELGVDSLMAVTLSHAIEVESSVEFGTMPFLQKPTVRKLAADWLAMRLRQAGKGPSKAAEDWVQLSAPQAPRMRLLCFPGAGMGARGFAELAGALPDIEVFGMSYPAGVERPDEDVESMQALGRRMAAVVAQLPPSAAPPALLGHSFGGLIAYETAYVLQQSGIPAPELILVASGVPHARYLFNEEEGRRAWASMTDAVASQSRHLATIRRLAEDYVVRPDERAKLHKPLNLVLAQRDEYFNNDRLAHWAEFATSTTSHYIDAGHHLLDHPEVAEVVREVFREVTGSAARS